MSQMTQEDARRRAFHNLSLALDTRSRLPGRVYHGAWNRFLFFESDRVFAPEFAGVIGELLKLEGGQVACLLNIDKATLVESKMRGAIFLDAITTNRSYEAALEGDGPANGWIYQMDNYGCMSDIGEWCIYCEKANDIALIALRETTIDENKFEIPLQHLCAKPIEQLISGGDSPLFPFDHLVPAWRKGLIDNYGSAGSQKS